MSKMCPCTRAGEMVAARIEAPQFNIFKTTLEHHTTQFIHNYICIVHVA